MAYEFAMLAFIIVSCIYGIYRGLFRELSFLVVLVLSLFIASFINPLTSKIFIEILDIDTWYVYLEKVLSFLSISKKYFEFIFCNLLPFVIICPLLNLISYNIFFKDKSYKGFKSKEVTKLQRLLGLVTGAFVGVLISAFMVITLGSLVSFDYTGIFSSLLVKIPNISGYLV